MRPTRHITHIDGHGREFASLVDLLGAVKESEGNSFHLRFSFGINVSIPTKLLEQRVFGTLFQDTPDATVINNPN